MARITYVKHARQRFEMVPKLDEQGKPVVVPVTRRGGEAKTTKSGREVFRNVTVQDRSKPLPNYKCQKCGTEILPGQPYKWIEPKMRGMMVRCTSCPNWNVWEYSSSLSARIAEVQSNAADALAGDFESADDLTSILGDIASEIRSLAEEKEEAASNMEEGFGHETYQSAEIREQAEQLESWADEVENTDIPEAPTTDEVECEDEWHEEDEEDRDGDVCPECGGDTPQLVEADDVEGGTIDDWREEARNAAQEAVDNCPL